jgi:hypothetical protein
MEELTVDPFDDEEALPSGECSHVCRGDVPNINLDVTTVGRQLLLVLSVQEIVEARIRRINRLQGHYVWFHRAKNLRRLVLSPVGVEFSGDLPAEG